LKKKICIIDGQGGGIGSAIIKQLREILGESADLIGLGTNAIAASQMMRCGVNRVGSGENVIVRTVADANVIVGPISITWANSMMGEVTPRMAEAVMSSPALKILLPLNQENVFIIGLCKEPLPHLIKFLAEDELKEILKNV